MAATNYTPIQLYYSTTASAVPLAANLAQGELAINITDGKLYYEDNAGVVQVIATKGAGTIGGSTTQIQYNNAGALAGSSAMTFNNSTNVVTLTTLNLTNALGATYGGTAQSSYTQGDLLYSSATNTLSKLGIGTVDYILTSTGSVPQWSAPSSISVLTATNLAGGAAGSVPYQSAASTTTFLSIGAANRVMTSSGTAPQWVTSLTGLTGVSSSSITNTSLTSGRLVYSTTGGAQTDDADLTFNGTTLSAGGYSTSGLSTLVKTVTIGNSNFDGTAVFAAATPAKLYIGTGTVTDTTSAIGATNAVGAVSSLAITPIAATNTSVTYTNAATLYIAGAPSAGTNVTLTNPYSLYIAAGNAYFGGQLGVGLTPANNSYLVQSNLGISAGASIVAQGSLTGYTGAGLFMSYESTYGRLEAYDYSTSAYKDIGISPNGGSVGVGMAGSSTYGKLSVNGNIAQYGSVASGAELGRIAWFNTATGYDVASIRTFIGAGQVNRGEFGFYTNTGAAQTLALYISRTQFVGIGTGTSPSYYLDVNVSAPQTYAARIINTSGSFSTDSALLVSTSTASSARIISAQNAGTERFSVTGAGITTVGTSSGSINSSLSLQVQTGIAVANGLYTFGTWTTNSAGDVIITSNANPANTGVNSTVSIRGGTSGGGGPVQMAYFRSDGINFINTTGNGASDLNIRYNDGGGSGSLSITASSTGGGGASYFLMGNSDSGGAAGPVVMASANRALQFGVGNSFTSRSGGTFTEFWKINDTGQLQKTLTADATAIQILGSYSGNPTIIQIGQSASDGFISIKDAAGSTTYLTGYTNGTSTIASKFLVGPSGGSVTNTKAFLSGNTTIGKYTSKAGFTFVEPLSQDYSSNNGPTSFNIVLSATGVGEYYAKIYVIGLDPYSDSGYTTYTAEISGYLVTGLGTLISSAESPNNSFTFGTPTYSANTITIPVTTGANTNYRYSVNAMVVSSGGGDRPWSLGN